MEAAPKLPMISFDLNSCTENVHFGPQLKKYIAAFYGEDPESYITEINNLESLRAAAVRPTQDVNGVLLLKKYYCQLHFLKSRFPMEENQDASIQFSWRNNQLDLNYASTDVRYELMVIMYNIGALHSYLGAKESRNSQEGMKLACTHFQCAAWAFQTVKEKYHQFISYVSLVELVHFFQQVSLAQAQECILEKSMFDNRKPTIIAKIAVQLYSFYRQSLSILESVGEDYFRVVYKDWTKFLQFKIAYFRCIALLFQGQQAEEQQKMGERVGYYQAACEQLEEAKKFITSLKNQDQQQEINEALAFTSDVVEGKRKAGKNENEFIYHESVPEKDQLEEIKGASLVKGIPFSINDLEVSGTDIFARLVPMEAHEAASLYSEKKAQVLRQMGELIESKDQTLAEFMSSLQLDLLTKMHQATGIPQDLIDRAAALSAKPNAVQDLISSMGKLSNIYQEVEASLNEIESLLKEEEEAEKVYQEKIGKRPPSILATDLTREAAKYKEAHTKANESNQTLHRAMTAHVANLKILQRPLKELQLNLPFVELPNPNIEEQSLKDLEALVAKVDEMRTQRAMLWAQLREAVHNDDITSSLVTKQPSQSLEQLFQQELQKHQQLISLIEQNTSAQENIKKALVDSYAQAVNTRRYIQDILQRRSTTISALMASSDSYEDLLSKANKGIEFYTKLETNVSKLLQRIRSTCKVQQEEREQVLGKAEISSAPTNEDTSSSVTTPKLKDFLESRKRNPATNTFTDPNMQYSQPAVTYGMSMEVTPGIRPAPLGSEFTDLPKNVGNEPQEYMRYNYNYQQPTGHNPQYGEDGLMKRMNSLMTNKKDIQPQNYSQYSAYNYVPPNYNPNYPVVQSSGASSPYDPQKAFTSTTNAYRALQTSASTSFVQHQDGSLNSTVAMGVANNSMGNYQYQNIPQAMSSGMEQHNVNTYYPQGYGPNSTASSAADPQHVSGQAKYHSVEYSSSVQPNISNYNQTPFYSSPMSNMASTNTSDQNQIAPNNAHYYSPNSMGSNAPQSGTNQQLNSQGATQGYPPTGDMHHYTQMNQGYTPDMRSSSPYFSNQNLPANLRQSNSQYLSNQTVPANVDLTNSSYPTNQSVPSNSPYQSNQNQTNSTYVANQKINTNEIQPISAYYSNTHLIAGNTPANIQSYAPYGVDQNSSYYANTNQNIGGTYVPNQIPNQTYTQYYPTVNTPVSQSGVSTALPDQSSMNYSYQQYYGSTQSSTNQPNYSHSAPVQTPTQSPSPAKTSNLDLLSGLDFNISQAPLVPQQNIPTQSKESEVPPAIPESKVIPAKPSSSQEQKEVVPDVKRPSFKVLPSKALNNKDAKNLFNQELEKYEKFVETLTNKTLSGPTNLELKWKEIQDQQEFDAQKKIISVARCYPMKNRYPDILPYDYSRVELCDSKDDYINASFVKEISPYAPPFIVTQLPLPATVGDFWTMVREQQVELILCLQNDKEIGEEIYWPKEKGQNLNVLNMVLSLQSVITKSHWVERLISVNLPEKRESRVVLHLQFTSWPGSLFPTTSEPFISYVLESINMFQQQKSNTHPVVVHCSSGIGRSGLICLLTAAIFDVNNNTNFLPDLTVLAIKLSTCRKNILRDREHLKFAFESFLAYMRQVVSEDKMRKKLSELEPKRMEELQPPPAVPEANIDPLSTLDPFWASKK